MEKSPLVSVAIVTYNQKDYLKECLESVLSQDYDALEIVGADDGSADGTPELLREYAEGHPGKFVLKLAESNRGITGNHNLAYFACSGKYIAWIGGDDLMLPGKIRAQVEHLESHPECAISYHNLEVFESPSGRVIGKFNDAARDGSLRDAVKHGTFNGACSTMVRRDQCPPKGFDERVPMGSDWLFWVETLRDGGTICYLDRVLGRYRKHEGNVTRQKLEKLVQDHLVSCAIILLEMPFLWREVKYRTAALFDMLRHESPPGLREPYLVASLGYRPTLKKWVGLWLYRMGIRNL